MATAASPGVQMPVSFEVGDKIPYATILKTDNGSQQSVVYLMGSPFVLFYFLKPDLKISNQLLSEFKQTYEHFKKLGVFIYGMCPESPEKIKEIIQDLKLPFVVFSDEGLVVGRILGVARSEILGSIESVFAKAKIFLLDGTLRVRQIIESVDPQAEIQLLLEEVPKYLSYREPAPILKIPFVFDQKLCQKILDIWHSVNTEKSLKFSNEEQEAVSKLVDQHLEKRVLPCLKNAFQYIPIYREPPRVIQHTKLQKDRILKVNELSAVQHREFAVIIPLTMNVQEGNEIEFLEYGPTQYHIEVGEALVFSCDLLHQYLSSKKEDIFWFMTFLYRENSDPSSQILNNHIPHIPDNLF